MRFVPLLALVACSNPVVDDAVARLGPERGPENGEHRPGQPCVLCHSDVGPAKTHFSLGGTIFANADATRGAEGVEVRVATPDRELVVVTNRAGNFWVPRGGQPLVFPLSVTIYKPGVARLPMTTLVRREPSCATCHFRPDDAANLDASGKPRAYPPSHRTVGPIVLAEGDAGS